MVDTARKRKQAAAAGFGGILPFPGGTLDAVDRAILTGVYLPGLADGSGSESAESDGMKLIKYVSSQPIACSGGNQNEVILWVKPELVASPYCEGSGAAFDFIDAIIEAECKTADGCNWKYAIAYDETLLLPGKLLKSSDILGVMCKGPLANWTIALAGSEVQLINNEDGTYTFRSQHGCEETFFSGDGVGGVLSVEHGGTGVETVNEFFPAFMMAWDTWEPEVTSSGGMVISDFQAIQATYMPFGNQAYLFSLAFVCTLSPTLSNKFYISTPLASESDSEPEIGVNIGANWPMTVLNPGATPANAYWRVEPGNQIAIISLGANHAAGTFHGAINGWARQAV